MKDSYLHVPYRSPDTSDSEIGMLRQPVHDDDEDSVVSLQPEPLAEDLYGVGISSLIRDTIKITEGEGRIVLRFFRLVITMSLMMSVVLAQGFLVFQLKKLVTAQAVTHIRTVYDSYETIMYPGHTFKTVNGFNRGMPGYFQIENFKKIPADQLEEICQVPFSQPIFFSFILLIWTFTVVSDLRENWRLFHLMVFHVSTVASTSTMLSKNPGSVHLLNGLTLPLKFVLVFCLFLPRFLLDGVLLWLGCRWLAATPSFSDLLLNAVALEFILALKDMLYRAVVPIRDKVDLQTVVIPVGIRQAANCHSYLGAFSWIVIAVMWVYVYIHFLQSVLPMYNWDVHLACEDYIAEVTSGRKIV